MHYFFFEEIRNGLIHLDDEESRHLQVVLRHREGGSLYLLNGKGIKAEGVLVSRDSSGAVIRPTSVQQVPLPEIRFHIGIGPPKQTERFEWFLEKVTEAGIHQITPFLSARGERSVLRADRLEKIIRSAGKQSGNPWFPKLQPMVTLEALLHSATEPSRYIAHRLAGDRSQPHLKDRISGHGDTLVLVGPEGDFTEKEVAQARAFGFEVVHLGENRLRTETAGIFAAHCLILQRKNR